ncbi:MAG TPA: flagellar hook-basal body complex protein FliE [Vulgatibacter sp.]|nr:flagellar hook-basal body complex protein FliE [Vulgatibacter sp.]
MHSLEVPSISAGEHVDGASFSDALRAALRAVEAHQLTADTEATKLALGGGNLHETSIALEQADIAIRLATKVRNKVVDCYHEIMRMQL